jgi:predicted Zn-dependent peptidase
VSRGTNRLNALAVLFVLVAAFAAAPLAQQAPDRSKPPAVGPPPALHLPPLEKRTLSNGLPVWIMGIHKVPTVHVQLVIKSGSAVDPAKKYGLASLTADMLDEGAGTRSALDIADAVDYLGATLNTEARSDASYVDLHVPVARLADALSIFADVAVKPTFPESELKRLREEALTSLIQAQDDPEQLVQFAFPRLLYGATHRYGTLSMGTAASLKGLTVDDLKAFHASEYRPGNATVVVTGDIAPDTVVPQLEQALGSWKGGAGTAVQISQAPQVTARRLILIDKPGAAQSQIRIGSVGVPRSTPDYFALSVLNTILGGSFTSRLNSNLREQHGYAYGASSFFDMRRAAGPFYAAAGVQTDKTSEALTEFFKELTRIHETVPADELEKAKSSLSLALPRRFETTRAMAGSLSQLYLYDLPADFYATYGERVHAVTAADVKRAADKYIVPDKMLVVVVGDRKVIEAGVRALNLGPVTIVDAAEVMK